MAPSEISWAINSISESQTIWEPHWGCAVLAGQALLDEELVEADARPHVQAVVDSIIKDHPTGGTARHIPEESGTREDVLNILGQDTGAVYQLGHDAIYSAYILSTLAAHPGLERGQVWASAARLLDVIRKSGPGWITINGKNIVLRVPTTSGSGGKGVTLNKADDILKCFTGFNRSARMEKGDQQLGHLLTHVHAIYKLHRLGFTDLAEAASHSFWARVEILNHANMLEDEILPFEPLSFNPKEAVFWKLAMEKWTGGHGHLLKYAYSFLALRRESSLPESETSKAFCRILCSLQKTKRT